MTQRRLTDSELAQRLRQRNRQASERRRERLAAGGNVQLLTWIPASLRERVDAAASASGLKLSPMVEHLLTLGLSAPAPVSPPPSVDATPTPKATAIDLTPDLFETPAPATRQYEIEPENHHSGGPPLAGTYSPPLPYRSNSTPATPAPTEGKDALMTWVGERLNENLSGNEVARKLNAAGRRTASGAVFNGANLLRDYRAWCQKSGAVDTSTTRNPT